MNVRQIIDAANFDDDDHHAGTKGKCGTFAITLYKMIPGGHLVLIVRDYRGEPEVLGHRGYAWHHVAVRYGDKYYDVLGEFEGHELIENYICTAGRGHVVEVGEGEFWSSVREVPGAYSEHWRKKFRRKLEKAVEKLNPTAEAA